ncbi:MAG: hypothetical protein KY476_25315 [Planctomycetes bacterium]|nr:hypothetical protein [Planctomycetota bacterium]
MYRTFAAAALVVLSGSLVGCCFKPVTYDPVTGVMYGGGLEPCCCGPLDPFCLFCNGCEQPLYPRFWPWHLWGGCGLGQGFGCGMGCGAGCGLGCEPVADCACGGGCHCGSPHTVLGAPPYGGGYYPQPMPGPAYWSDPAMMAPPAGVQSYPSIQGGGQPVPQPAPPEQPEDSGTGLIVPDPVAPPSAVKQAPSQPQSIQGQSRWIPARR